MEVGNLVPLLDHKKCIGHFCSLDLMLNCLSASKTNLENAEKSKRNFRMDG